LGLGTTASGVVLGLGIKAGLSSSTASALLVGFAPLLALFVCVLWLGEMERMVRAGAQIASLEQRISEKIDPHDPPLSWETSLRFHQPSRHRILSVYRSIFGLLVLIATMSSVLGNLGVSDRSKPLLLAATSLLDAAIVTTLTRN
jgi:hypothetical protein